MIKQKAQIKELKQGVDQSLFVLLLNGVPACCPFKQPLPKPNPLTGQVEIKQEACYSNCPMFQIVETNPINEEPVKTTLVVSCGGMPVEREVEVIRAEELKSESMIV